MANDFNIRKGDLNLTKALDTVTFTAADAVTGGNTGTTGNGYYVTWGLLL